MTKMRGGNVADLVESAAVPDILRRPYLLTTVILVVIAVSIASSAVAAAVGFPRETVEIFTEAALACIAAVVLTRFRLWRTVGFRALAPRDLRLYWVPLFPVLVMVPSVAARVGDIGLKQVGFYLALAALVGFTEEVAFRGMILQSISHRGPWQAAIISAGLFGLMHSLNMFAGADPTGTGIQVIYASALGFCFAAITLRTGAIWPLVIIHGLTDIAGFTTAGSTIPDAVSSRDLLIYSTYIVLFAGYGVLLMRQTTPPTTALVLAGCTATEPQASAESSSGAETGEPALRPFYDQAIDWSSGEDFECGTAQVPVDYADPAAGSIQLAVKRAPATGADPIGSLLINPGGPGASGFDLVNRVGTMLGKDVLATYDVVGCDPRGVARSSPVTCLYDAAKDAFV